jgi:hypothetical protein
VRALALTTLQFKEVFTSANWLVRVYQVLPSNAGDDAEVDGDAEAQPADRAVQ